MNNICFNERQNIWTTKYDWNPTISENINGKFFSIGGSNAEDESNQDIWSHDPSESDPTIWYGEQHPFEFEFVVSEPAGVHKILENLQIISNNVQPEELTFEFIGDAYQFNKERIEHLSRSDDNFTGRIKSNLLNKTDKNIPKQTESQSEKIDLSNWFRNQSKIKVFDSEENVPIWNHEVEQHSTTMEQDPRTKQFIINIPQECRNIETYGRRLGNIQYAQDCWNVTVEPIIYDTGINEKVPTTSNKLKSARIRDKWIKIRVRYTGEDLAIITAIKSILNI